ncbi:hypothetical protein [Aureimonas frigidaquae]|uniref:hypothetical protein n=1 Tax=Aureimonas frigidaquae TaxID=424757 RepID=UPI000782A199|nr:hypothetical protein [Aureimonas frigidaquae]
MAKTPATPAQLPLDLDIQVERDVDGIEMGVLDNGMTYLTQRGLAAITGAARSTIQEISKEWEDNWGTDILPRGRARYFQDYLQEQGFDNHTLYLEITRNGSPYYAYPDVVCMAMIEFFAFEAQRTNDTALTNFRRLAQLGLNKFIYKALNYAPLDPWQYFNDRVTILQDSAPDGYFIVFKETTGMIVDLIRTGLPVDNRTIPDQSVGQHWARHWSDGGAGLGHNERIPFAHNFPAYYPQAKSNPQQAWAYPDSALPEFRRWFRHVYLPTKYPSYILSKHNVLKGGKAEALKLAEMYDPRKVTKR